MISILDQMVSNRTETSNPTHSVAVS